MNKIKKRAKEIYDSVLLNYMYTGNFNFDEGLEAMIEFARECCELQKQECVNSKEMITEEYDGFKRRYADWTVNSILNCKNICDES